MVSSCGGTSDKNGRKAPQALDQVMQPHSTPFPPAAPPPAPLRSGGCGLPRGSFSEARKTEVTHAQLRLLWPFGPPPRPLPRPELPGGAGPRVQQPWLGLQ